MSVVCQTGQVNYQIIKSKRRVGHNEISIYGIEGSDGMMTLHIEGLTYDLNRIKGLVEILNKNQINLDLLEEIVEKFLKEQYGIKL